MYNVVSYKNKPAVVISSNNNVASVMYFIEEDNMVRAVIDTVYDKALITDYTCPHANETDPPRMHGLDGKCRYCMQSPAKLSFMCSSCLAESLVFEDDDMES